MVMFLRSILLSATRWSITLMAYLLILLSLFFAAFATIFYRCTTQLGVLEERVWNYQAHVNNWPRGSLATERSWLFRSAPERKE